jgi:hypothetical protein
MASSRHGAWLGLWLAFGCARSGRAPADQGVPDVVDATAMTMTAPVPDAATVVAMYDARPVSASCAKAAIDGTYVGPSEAYVLVQCGEVRALKLLYTGNKGFTFAGQRVDVTGEWPVVTDSFTVKTNLPTIQGKFSRVGHIDGMWMENALGGTWYANRSDGDGGVTDAPVDVPARLDARPPDVRADVRGN